jgi:hypothetical protein
MAFYRFIEPVKQTNYIEFGLSIGQVCDHLKGMGIGITEFRVRTSRLTFNTTANIPAEQIPHLGLELG